MTEEDDDDGVTVAEALARYLMEVSSAKSPTTQARETRMARMLSERLGRLPLEEVSPLELAAFRDARLKEASAAIVARDMALLTDLFDVAASRWGVALAGNPVGNVAPPAPVQGRGRRLKPGERARLLAACARHANPMLGWVVQIAMETAMRKTEILGLKQADVALRQRVVHLPRTGSWAPRHVPLNKETAKVFSAAIKHARTVKETPLIFFGEPGQFGTRRAYAIDKVFRKALLDARLKSFSFDDLRLDAVERMREAGLSDEEVAAIAGLKTPRIDRRADHLQPEALVKRLDAVSGR